MQLLSTFTTLGFNNTNYKNKNVQVLPRAFKGALCKGGPLKLKLHQLSDDAAPGHYDTGTLPILDRPEKGEDEMKKIVLEHNVFPEKKQFL